VKKKRRIAIHHPTTVSRGDVIRNGAKTISLPNVVWRKTPSNKQTNKAKLKRTCCQITSSSYDITIFYDIYELSIPIFLAYLVPLDVDVTGNITAKLCEVWSEFNIACT
jgi:hypothetical protein